MAGVEGPGVGRGGRLLLSELLRLTKQPDSTLNSQPSPWKRLSLRVELNRTMDKQVLAVLGLRKAPPRSPSCDRCASGCFSRRDAGRGPRLDGQPAHLCVELGLGQSREYSSPGSRGPQASGVAGFQKEASPGLRVHHGCGVAELPGTLMGFSLCLGGSEGSHSWVARKTDESLDSAIPL